MELIIKNLSFDGDQYYHKQYEKAQIVLHHTVSPSSLYTRTNGILGDINHWRSNKERVATCCIIGSEGIVYKLFSSSKWAHHLGIEEGVFKEHGLANLNLYLNQRSIGIELDNFGPLVYENGVFKPAADYLQNSSYVVKEENVIEYDSPYRGYTYYERYTSEQIASLKTILLNWSEVYDIPLTYNEDMWDVSKAALSGVKGIWTHTSYRYDKSDCHPDPNLIAMLKELERNKNPSVVTNGEVVYHTPKEPVVFTPSYLSNKEFYRKIDEIFNLNSLNRYQT